MRQELEALANRVVVMAFWVCRRHQHSCRGDFPFFPRVPVGICHSNKGVTKAKSRQFLNYVSLQVLNFQEVVVSCA